MEGRDRFVAGSSSACDSTTSGNEVFPRAEARDLDAGAEPERVDGRLAFEGGFCDVSGSSAMSSVVWPRLRFAGSDSGCAGSTDALVERDDLLGGIAEGEAAIKTRRSRTCHASTGRRQQLERSIKQKRSVKI